MGCLVSKGEKRGDSQGAGGGADQGGRGNLRRHAKPHRPSSYVTEDRRPAGKKEGTAWRASAKKKLILQSTTEITEPPYKKKPARTEEQSRGAGREGGGLTFEVGTKLRTLY